MQHAHHLVDLAAVLKMSQQQQRMVGGLPQLREDIFYLLGAVRGGTYGLLQNSVVDRSLGLRQGQSGGGVCVRGKARGVGGGGDVKEDGVNEAVEAWMVTAGHGRLRGGNIN